MIAGMDEGLIGVCVGEKRTVTIPPHLGYGEEGTGVCVTGSVAMFPGSYAPRVLCSPAQYLLNMTHLINSKPLTLILECRLIGEQ